MMLTRAVGSISVGRVLPGVQGRGLGPPALRGPDGLEAGWAHGPGRACRAGGGTLQTGKVENLMG